MFKKYIVTAIILLCSTCAFSAQPPVGYVSTDAKLEYNKGIDYYGSGQFDKAIECFRRAIDLEPNYIDAYYNLATTFEYLKQYEASVSMFRELLNYKPDDYAAAYRAAIVSYKMKNIELTKEFLGKLPSTSPYYYQGQELATLIGTNMETIRANYAPENSPEEEAPTTALKPKASITEDTVPAVSETKAAEEPQQEQSVEEKTEQEQTAEEKKEEVKEEVKQEQKQEELAEIEIEQPKKPTFAGNFYYEGIPSPTGIATDNVGYLYVADYSDNAIFRVTPTGEKTIYLKSPKIKGPIGLALDDDGNMYIANYDGDNILKLSNSNQLSVFIENIDKPYYVYVNGNFLFVSSQGSNSVLRYQLN